MAIRRALATNPQVLLLDEVTSALDPELVADVLGLVRELTEAGMTLVIATHQMAFARQVPRPPVITPRHHPGSQHGHDTGHGTGSPHGCRNERSPAT